MGEGGFYYALEGTYFADVILETMNRVTSFPRRPDEAGLIPVDLKRKHDYLIKQLLDCNLNQ